MLQNVRKHSEEKVKLKFHCYLVFRSPSPEGHAVFGLQAIADLALALAWHWIVGNVFLKEMVVISLRGWEVFNRTGQD
jgi:hypothetical protein